MSDEPYVCNVCGKKLKSAQGLSGHLQMAHGTLAKAKKIPRGGVQVDRFQELRDFVDLRYKMVMARYLEIEIQRLERELSAQRISTQPNMLKSNVIVLPLTPQEPESLCPVCGKAISEHYEARERAMQSRREGVKSGYACPHCNAVLYPSTV